MSPWRSSLLLAAGVAFVFAPTAAKDVKPPSSVIIQLKADSFVSTGNVVLKVSIANNSREDLGFDTCPLPYSVQISDQLGNIIPLRRNTGNSSIEIDTITGEPSMQIADLPLCSRTFLQVIKRGETWTTEIALGEGIELSPPGTYTAQVQWQFYVHINKAAYGGVPDTLSISSNQIKINITSR
jgi:hypothetical protein